MISRNLTTIYLVRWLYSIAKKPQSGFGKLLKYINYGFINAE